MERVTKEIKCIIEKITVLNEEIEDSLSISEVEAKKRNEKTEQVKELVARANFLADQEIKKEN